MKKGLVSVVMAVHNEPKDYLKVALESIFNQTWDNVEVIIIDDASTPECKSVLIDLCKDKSNVKIIHNETNIGLTNSLNIGLNLAEGEFIARMDSDDYSLQNRFELQVGFLLDNPQIDILGTGVVTFGDENKFMSPAFGNYNKRAQCDLFFSSTLCHPSVMIRKEFLDKYNLRYDENVKKGQDYDLWERASVHGKLAVMKEVLLYYRTHSNQITSTNQSDQNSTSEMVQKRRLGRIGIEPTEKEFKCHLLLAKGIDSSVSVEDISNWIDKIISQNAKYQFVDETILKRSLLSRLTLYKMRSRLGLFSYNFSDYKRAYKIVRWRLKTQSKLKNEINRMHQILKTNEE